MVSEKRKAMSYGRPTLGGRLEWDRFEEAVYEYAQECAFIELEKKGYLEPPPRDYLWWAYEYLPAFFERFDEEDTFEGVGLDEEYVKEEAEYRFVRSFRDGWRVTYSGSMSLEEECG